jgi:hypothetical protein
MTIVNAMVLEDALLINTVQNVWIWCLFIQIFMILKIALLVTQAVKLASDQMQIHVILAPMETT